MVHRPEFLKHRPILVKKAMTRLGFEKIKNNQPAQLAIGGAGPSQSGSLIRGEGDPTPNVTFTGEDCNGTVGPNGECSRALMPQPSASDDPLRDSRRQGLIYIPVRSRKLKGLAQIWNQHRFSTGKGLYGVLHKPDDMLERAWLATRPLRDLDCEAKLYVLLDADVPGHAGENIVGGVEDPVAYSMEKKAGTREVRSANPLSPLLKFGNNCFVSDEHIWSPKDFARHMGEAGLPTDFRFLRVYVGFSHYVKSKHEGACYDSHPGCAFVKEFTAAMNKNGYKHLEVRGYFGMLSMGGDDMSRDYRYTKIYFENPRPAATPEYFKPSQKSFVYYSNTDDVRSGTALGRTTQAAEKAAAFIRNPADFMRKSIRDSAAKKLNPLA
ncbi:conserved hypothetical protein [Chelatococcus asaccharovorans]|nr:conserved hypothetical protein [Chelatococcus asaccharovorans]CAH1675964.1 conserved hypothetical protein [Chelatococcus asaccharovorans]